MGSAIECFAGATAAVVPRARVVPIKTTSDLFALRSDACTVTKDATVALAYAQAPLVRLDDAHYKLVDQIDALVAASPSLKDSFALTVVGAVRFEAGAVVKGEVTLRNAAPGPVAVREQAFEDVGVDVGAGGAAQ
jgi:UTP--glucose-1-phosphate uridylyltransferase